MQSLRTQIAAKRRMLRRLDEEMERQQDLKLTGRTSPAHADLMIGLLIKAKAETTAELAAFEGALSADDVE